MKRKLPLVALVGFLAYTGSYIFVYLWRAFRIRSAGEVRPVLIWHGDPFARAILAAILFLIGLVILVYMAIARSHGVRAGQVRLRQDLWDWLVRESEEANESPSRLAERALVAYRARMEGLRTR
ncbi:MAG: hypothetical protein HYU54_10135 [Actinobacteria bacterium]|nr:hypothetical protein [Actinomycetota bacterium]